MPSKRINLAKDSTMTFLAKVLADAIRKYAPYDSIKKSVRIGRRQRSGSSVFITVNVGGKRAPFAKAFDVGSGIHGKERRTYKILPRTKMALWFPYPSPKTYPGATAFIKNGIFGITTPEVNHPGVEGVHYTKAAIKEVRPVIRREIKKNIQEDFRLYLKANFSKLGE